MLVKTEQKKDSFKKGTKVLFFLRLCLKAGNTLLYL
jgi:hypothetical protein